MLSERDGDQNGSWLIQALCGCPIAFLLNPNVWIVPEHWAGTNCENTNISSVVVRKAKPITLCADTAVCSGEPAKLLPWLQPVHWHLLFNGVKKTAAFGAEVTSSAMRWGHPLDLHPSSSEDILINCLRCLPWSDLYQCDLSCPSPTLWGGRGRFCVPLVYQWWFNRPSRYI